jgi:hypothetical protein
MRSLTLTFLTAVLIPTIAGSATLVAPAPHVMVPLPFENSDADGATNGSNTLVAWRQSNLFSRSISINARLIDERNPNSATISLGSGFNPTVASNGLDYLVGFETFSRLNVNYAPVALRRIRQNGMVAEGRLLDTGSAGRPLAALGGIAWDGKHWLVGYSDGASRVAILTEGLEEVVPPISLPGTLAPALEQVGGRWWAVFVDAEARGHVIEIGSAGVTGNAFELSSVTSLHLAGLGSGAVAASVSGTRLEIRLFDPATGFSAVTDSRDGGTIVDLEPWRDGALLVETNANQTTRLSAIRTNGTIERSVRVIAREPALIDSPNGSAILHTAPAGPDLNDSILLALLLDLPADGSSLNGTIVSLIDAGQQSAPILGTTGSSAVVFWAENSSLAPAIALHALPVDSAGHPAGPVNVLPLEGVIPHDVSFDGSRFTLIGLRQSDVVATTITSDGRSLGNVSVLGSGFGPQVEVSNGRTFAAWNQEGTIRGTALRSDATPEVPGGFEILPSFRNDQGAFALNALSDGFQLVVGGVNVQSLTLTPAGTVRTLTVLSNASGTTMVAASDVTSGLAAWTEPDASTLYTFGQGAQPFERFDPRWGASWTPMAIATLGSGHYVVAFRAGTKSYLTEVTLQGAFLTALGPVRAIGDASVSRTPAVSTNGNTLLAYQTREGLWLDTVAEIAIPRRRAAGR